MTLRGADYKLLWYSRRDWNHKQTHCVSTHEKKHDQIAMVAGARTFSSHEFDNFVELPGLLEAAIVVEFHESKRVSVGGVYEGSGIALASRQISGGIVFLAEVTGICETMSGRPDAGVVVEPRPHASRACEKQRSYRGIIAPPPFPAKRNCKFR
jgi:hypothetical protein